MDSLLEEYVVSSEELASRKTEYNEYQFRKLLEDTKPKVCVNCSSTEDVEYHHIVPLSLGGTNNLSNIVPLCFDCHKRVHGAKSTNKISRGNKAGRKRMQPVDGYKEILDRYITNEIGTKECKELLGLKKGHKLSDVWYIKEYYDSLGIERVNNKVDLMNCHKNKSKKQENKNVSPKKCETKHVVTNVKRHRNVSAVRINGKMQLVSS